MTKEDKKEVENLVKIICNTTIGNEYGREMHMWAYRIIMQAF